MPSSRSVRWASVRSDNWVRSPSAEVRARIEWLLSTRKRGAPELIRIEQAVRALAYMETPEARKLLEQLAQGAKGAAVTTLAKTALARQAAKR